MSKKQIDEIAEEYDFSKGERGKCFKAGATLSRPEHLEPDVLRFLKAKAKARGTTVSALVNHSFERDIELIEAAG